MLKKELDFTDESIRKIDDIGNSIKNWSILSRLDWSNCYNFRKTRIILCGLVVSKCNHCYSSLLRSPSNIRE